MKVGIVAEGWSDIAVLRNILKGALDLDGHHVLALRPELAQDVTDLHSPSAAQFSNWGHVLDECQQQRSIGPFLDAPIDEIRIIVVQIDTAECELKGFDVARPERGADGYAEALRARVVQKLEALLGPDLARHCRFAIAVEETDAWVLALYEDGDSARFLNPKDRLERTVDFAKVARRLKGPDRYTELSRPLRKRKILAQASTRNASLRAFLESLPQPE